MGKPRVNRTYTGRIMYIPTDPADRMPKAVTCVYCNTDYKSDSKSGCPTCGGTVTDMTVDPMIGEAYDMYMNPDFKPDKIPDGEKYFVPPEKKVSTWLESIKEPI